MPTTANATSTSASIDPDALMRIKSLKLRAKLVVEGFFSGLHRSPTHGASIEFSEYRAYVPGDDLRNLDWKLFARSDRYFIKKYEDETNRRCYLIVDQSRSMNYGSIEYQKIEYGRTLAATLAYFLTLQRDAVGLLTFDAELGDLLPAKIGAKHLHQIFVNLSRPAEGIGTDLDLPLRQITNVVPRRGLVVMISDLLAPVKLLERELAGLRARGHEVVILRVLDPSEIGFNLESPAMVVDSETQKQIYIDPTTATKQYAEKFQQHEERIKAICREYGISFHQLRTDRPLDVALASLIDAKNRLASTAGRVRQGGRA